MFIDLFKDKIKDCPPEQMRALVYGLLLDLEAMQGTLDANALKTELMNTFMVYLFE